MKKFLTKNKQIIRWGSIIPFAILIPINPVNIGLLMIQLTCFGLMFWIGWAD